MLTLQPSSREKPGQLACGCGGTTNFTIHHDYLEGYCTKCLTDYVVKIESTERGAIWNCCSMPENPPSRT
jgi:hypothetical protein